MSREAIHQVHCEIGDKVLSSWFDDKRFRAAWQPDVGLFATDAQRAIAGIAAARGEQLDPEGLVLALQRSGKLKFWSEPAGVYQHLHAPLVVDPWAELESLKRIAGARDLRAKLERAMLDLDQGEDFDAVRGRVAEMARDADASSGGKMRTIREMVGTAFAAATNEKRQPGQRTISKKLDQVTGGLNAGSVWLLAAGTNWGKSTAICALADQCCSDGRRPMIIALEDPEVLYGRRFLQLRTRVSGLRLRSGPLNALEHSLIADAYQASEDAPCFLNAIGRPVEAIAADIRSAVKSEGITHVFLDYIQRARCREKQQDRRLDIFYAGCLITDAIKDAGAAGVIASQLTEDEKTGKAKARDCEDLHNNAEVLLFGRKDVDDELDDDGKKKARKVSKRWLWVQKVKDGPAEFRIDLEWDNDAACFVSDYAGVPGQAHIQFGQQEAPENEYDDFDGYQQ